jgi:Na+-driven multidrug efflux pump
MRPSSSLTWRQYLIGRRKGAKEKNKMSFDIDTALWVLMAVAVAFVGCGCVLTAPAGTFRRTQ